MPEDNAVCPVCFHHCRLHEGEVGLCRARVCEGGESVCTNYGKITSLALDPIEKKPLARFMPGTKILSAGSFGCNLDCPFCQNDSISRAGEEDIHWRFIAPDELAALADKRRDEGNIGMAFTYNEPMVGFEYVRDAAKAVKARGMANVVVTNGSVTVETLGEVLLYIDAFNIDLKCFTEEGYKQLGGDLETVLEFIKLAAVHSHVEITTLVIPGFNDTAREITELVEWVASIDRAIPLHLTRFFPRSRWAEKSPTPISVLHRLKDIASEKLDTVLIGNI
jgi:Pyruvate-formate lyase-activating enzyme